MLARTKPNKRATTEADIVLGIRIRETRELKGVSQVDLADCLDLSHQQVIRYEQGRTRITVARLIQIGRVLDVTIAILMGDAVAVNDIGELAPNLALMIVCPAARNLMAAVNMLFVAGHQEDIAELARVAARFAAIP